MPEETQNQKVAKVKKDRKGEFSRQENNKPPVEIVKPEELFPQTERLPQVREVIRPIAKIEEIVEAFKQYQTLKKKLQDEGDVVVIRDKECSTKGYDNKLSKFFGLSVEIIRAYKEDLAGPNGDKYFVWRVWAKATAPSGQFRVSGAACGSNERNFAHLEHDVYAMAETRAKKRAIEELVGFGETIPIEEAEEELEEKAPKEEVEEGPKNVYRPKMESGSPKFKENHISNPDMPATPKQKEVLRETMEKIEIFFNEKTELPKPLDELTKGEAWELIQRLFERAKKLKESAGMA